jgi:signal transduction histidine kinase
MATIMKNPSSSHILTLVIQKDTDIVRVRSKVKLLVRAVGGPVERVIGIAVGASETSRLLLQRYGGGKVRISLFPVEIPGDGPQCGVELIFHSNAGCIQGTSCPLDREALLEEHPFPGLKRVFGEVRVEGGTHGRNVTVRCQSRSLGTEWENIHGYLGNIRRDLFADTEESYLENLRAKHDEVTRLLREKTEQNRLLDQSNNELLQLGNDLEELARQRAIIEMSLRIADQVRNPATVIGGMARRLLEKGDLPRKTAKKIALIRAEADKVERIVRQFTAMAAQHRTVFSREDIVELLGEALHSCPTLHRKHISVQLITPDNPVQVHANRQLLKIALVHVLRFLVRGSPRVEALEIEVREDNGPVVAFSFSRRQGPEAEYAPGNTTGKEKKEGLGLVRQILEEHQAELDVAVDSGRKEVVILRFPVVFREQSFPDPK